MLERAHFFKWAFSIYSKLLNNKETTQPFPLLNFATLNVIKFYSLNLSFVN